MFTKYANISSLEVIFNANNACLYEKTLKKIRSSLMFISYLITAYKKEKITKLNLQRFLTSKSEMNKSRFLRRFLRISPFFKFVSESVTDLSSFIY